MRARAGDWVRLSKVSVPCLLGIFEWEQRRTQVLELDLQMQVNLDVAAAGDLRRSINYARIHEQVCFIAQHGRWKLLESMAAAIARHVLAPPRPSDSRAQVETVIVRLTKPEVFEGRAVPSIEITRSAEWARNSLESRRVGEAAVDVLNETPQTGAYHIHLNAGAEWGVPAGMALHVMSGQLLHAGAELAAGAALPAGTSTVLAAATCSLLGIAQPPLVRK